MDPSVLRTGLSVNIKRSDGRVHGAAVSGIDTDRGIVAVEWFEKGETKGKEIDFEQIYSLNRELFHKQEATPSQPPQAAPQSRIPTASSSARSRVPVSQVQRNNIDKKDRRTIATPTENMPRAGHLRAVENVTNSSNGSEAKPSSVIPSRVREKAAAGGGRGSAPSVVREQQQQVQQKEKERSSDPVREPPPAAREKQLALKPPRKSNCVKEVERLKKNREERRAKQLAQRDDCDHSHPNWEFLQKIGDFLSRIELKPLQGDEEVYCRRITVCVRKRPLNKKEVNRKEIDVITVPDKSSVLVHEPKTKVDLTKYLDNQNFCFDYSFNEDVDNEVVYRFTAQPLVHTIFDRGMATCFAYGQTGSGKTHTMGGVFSGKEQDATRGVYAFAAADVFRLNASPENSNKDLTVSASFFEIYSGKVYDLLNKKVRLRILEDAKGQVQIVGLAEERVQNVQDILHLIHKGNICRTSGTTSANQHSSRSHAIFQIILRKRTSGRLFGKFSLIDLAGNERGADTASADRQTRLEGAEINKSLLALKECIRALGRRGAHLPFRGSKLTLVLKDSFVGNNSRTCMIAMISPGFNSCEHTINTLRYADRVKELSSNRGGGGDGGVVFSAPPPMSNDPSPQSPGDDEEQGSDDPTPIPSSPVHADLQYLHRSLQKESGGEMDLDKSSELLTFHEAISNLVESEEQLIEEHKSIIQADQLLLEEEQALLEYVDDVEHDIEEYVVRIEKIVSEKVERLSRFKERIRDLRVRLQEEETASKNIKRLPML